MNWMKILYTGFLAAAMLLAVNACGVSSVDDPTTTVDPVSASTIQNSDAIVITFSGAMDSSTLVLSGDMASESDGGVWSNTGVTNGRLKISPSADSGDTWAAGSRTLNVEVSSSSGGPLSLSLTYTVVAPVPTASAGPVSGSTLFGSDLIIVFFSIAMDTSTLLLTGDMAAESDGGIWSTTSEPDDTLVIRPRGFWTGNVSTLTINVDSVEGAALSALTLDYTIDVETPVATESPADESTINDTAPLIVTFNRTMEPSTLLPLSGSLGNESDDGVWSMSSTPNDTLTISPSSTWGGGLLRELIIDVKANNGIPLLKTLRYNVDTSQPIASVTPSTGTRITSGKLVVIDFNESMNIATLNASGSLLINGDNRAWSPANEQLTITPSSSWPAGNNRTLIVNIDDLVGNSLITLVLNYTVDVTAPTALADPINNTFLYGSNNIILSFSEEMSATQFIYSGLLEPSVATANWSNGDKTLTFTAFANWPVAANQTLAVTAEDVAGNAMTLNLSYTVATDECSDGVITLDETDIDCGGATCQSCSIGEKCLENTDCSSVLCDTAGTLICLASCGDSITTPPEQCDDGGESATCNLDCTTAVCGDATTNTTAGETCDDGNLINGDGCSSICQVEP